MPQPIRSFKGWQSENRRLVKKVDVGGAGSCPTETPKPLRAHVNANVNERGRLGLVESPPPHAFQCAMHVHPWAWIPSGMGLIGPMAMPLNERIRAWIVPAGTGEEVIGRRREETNISHRAF